MQSLARQKSTVVHTITAIPQYDYDCEYVCNGSDDFQPPSSWQICTKYEVVAVHANKDKPQPLKDTSASWWHS